MLEPFKDELTFNFLSCTENKSGLINWEEIGLVTNNHSMYTFSLASGESNDKIWPSECFIPANGEAVIIYMHYMEVHVPYSQYIL